jgi:hypothetical protein
MHRFRRAGLTGLSAALALLSLAPSYPVAAQAAPDISISDVQIDEGGLAEFTVSVVGAHPAFTVDYSTRGGTALAASDFTATSGTLTIGANSNSATISVQSTDDKVLESDETFYVDLDPLSTIANVVDGEGQGTLLNDDPVPALSVSDASVAEGDDPNAPVDMIFNVLLTNPASQDVTVHYTTREDSALGQGVDFRSKSGNLTFPAGTNTTQQVVVKVVGDTIHEGPESFKLKLSQPLNATISDNEGIGTIRDGGDPIPTVSLSTSAFEMFEGDGLSGPQLLGLAKVSLSHPTVDTVTVTVSTSNGSAVAGNDYPQVTNQLVTIPALSSSTNVTVRPTGDTQVEADENYFLVISNPTNANLGNSVQEVLIKNDD